MRPREAGGPCSLITGTKDPLKVKAGRASARKRWGETPRIARLDQLDPRVRTAVLALIRADEAARAEQERTNTEAA